MTKLKIALVAATAGLAIPALSAGTAHSAEAFRPTVYKVADPDPNDTARVKQDGRLRKTDEEHTNEQAVVKFFADGKHAVYVEMRTGALSTGEKPIDRIQGACTPLELVQQADGSVTFQELPGKKFISDNEGNEYRNFHKPELMPINGGKNMLVMFNYQPNGTNDTRRYAKVLDQNCNLVPVKNGQGQVRKQVQIMAKNNDDLDMHQSGDGPCDVSTDANGTTHLVCWAGGNGNGSDDGWLNDISVSCVNGAAGGASECTIKKNFDISLCKREERSRGRCTTSDEDPNTAVCCWTEGNTQPQRDGTWCAAVDVSANGEQGENADSRLLWKQQIGKREDVNGQRAYAMRMNSMRVMLPKADGTLEKSNMIMMYYGLSRGQNNNNKKGGTYLKAMMGVAKVTKTGIEFVTPMQDTTSLFLGTDQTHNTFVTAVFGEGASLMPGFTILNGSQIGAGISTATIKTIAWDPTTKKFLDLGTQDSGAYYDRHLYSNYLGNNPGNQGRNFAGGTLVKNPFAGQNGNTAQYLVVHAMTGKDPAYVDNAAMKGSSYLSILPVVTLAAPAPPPASTPPATPTPPPSGTGSDPNANNAATPPPASSPSTPSEPAAEQPESPSMMGCTAAPGSGGAGGAILLVAGVLGLCIVRRRRA